MRWESCWTCGAFTQCVRDTGQDVEMRDCPAKCGTVANYVAYMYPSSDAINAVFVELSIQPVGKYGKISFHLLDNNNYHSVVEALST